MTRQKYHSMCSAQPVSSLAQGVDQVVGWMRDDVLPLWVSEGVCRKLATAFPSISLNVHDGSRLLKPDNLSGWFGLSQAQLVYVMSQAQQLGWLQQDESELVRRMIEFSGRHGVLPCRSDGFVRQLSCDMSIVDDERLLLDHVYFMMASTASFITYDIGNDLRRAYNIMHWIDIKMIHPEGGWCHSYGIEEQASSESYLHSLQTFLYLFEVTKKPIWLERAAAVYDIFVERIFDPETLLVHKYLIDVDTGQGKTDELASPCQLFFWVWLLRRYQFHTGEVVGDLIEEICNQLYSRGKDFIAETAPSHSSLLLSSFVLASSYQTRVGSVDQDDFFYAIDLLRKYATFSPIKGWCSDKSPSNVFTATRFFYLFEAAREAYLYLNPCEREVPLKEVGGL